MNGRNLASAVSGISNRAMAGLRIGESVIPPQWPTHRLSHRRLTRPWLCAAVLIMTAGVAVAAWTQPQAQSGKKPDAQAAPQQHSPDDSQSGSQPDGSVDSADDLLKEFPPDSAVKSDNDPRDGHLPTEPAPRPLTPAEANPPRPAAGTAATGPPAQPAAKPVTKPETAASEPAHAAPVQPPAVQLPTDPRQRQVAIECADLLKMATDLKAAVDKSTKDELSVDVVRKAGELEQYARKVREGTRLTAGRE
jgi:hypothetical protein